EGDLQPVLVAEALQLAHRVARDADHRRPERGEVVGPGREVLAFGGAAGGVGLWREVDHGPLAAPVGQAHAAAAGGLQVQRRRRRALDDLGHGRTPQTGRTRTIFFLPAASFSTPSALRSAEVTGRAPSLIGWSFRRRPPPWARRRAPRS